MAHIVTRRNVLLSSSALAIAAVSSGDGSFGILAAQAQTAWKAERPIQAVIQFAAGGGTDAVVRTVLKEAEPVLGQRINATNMPGALGSVALEHVIQQPADGHTWLGCGGFVDYPRIAGMTSSVAWHDWQFYQTNTSIASWSVHPDSPFKTFADVIEYARANPGKLRVSSDGIGGLWHEAMAIIALKAGFKFTNVPFDGGAPATLAAVQREVDVAGSGLHEQAQFIRAGRLRHLAVFTSQPVPFGDKALEPITKYVPAAADATPFGAVYAIAVRRQTPQPVLQTLASVFERAVKSPGFQKMLADRFMQENFLTGAALDKRIAMMETQRAHLFQEIGLAKKTPQELGLPSPDKFDSWWPPQGYRPAL
jgi:tripartite-type tricarboxylate transporter receptor subunit TctC